jgi:hypothetical protein
MSRTNITVTNQTGTTLDFAIVHYSSDASTAEVYVCSNDDGQKFVLNASGGDHSQALNIAYQIPSGNMAAGLWDLQLSEKQIPIGVVGRDVTLAFVLDAEVPSVKFVASGQETKSRAMNKCTNPSKDCSGFNLLANQKC